MKTRVLQTLSFIICCMIFTFKADAQVESVNYYMKFNADSCWYDAYIVINSGSATTALDRTQFNAQMTVVVPTGDTLIITRNYAPYYNNQSGSNNSSPMEWTNTTFVGNPAASPGNDFYSIVPSLFPASQFNDINAGDTIKLFSFTVESYANCGSGIRWFENGSDPDSQAPGMKNGDFSNGYTLGSIGQLYNANEVNQYPPKPLLIDPPFVSCANGIFIDLDATTTESCQGPLTYAWAGPNYTGTSQDVTINPSLSSDAGLYKVVVTDAFGCKDSLQLTVDNKPDAGPDYVNCAGEVRTITGTNPGTGTWTAVGSNPAGATLGASVAGSATITFSASASGTYRFTYATTACSDEMQIVVNPKPVVSITGSTTICINSTTQLSPNTGGTWISNSPLVASVTNTGLVTGLTQGLANFTFTDINGCSSTTGNVIVNSAPLADAARDTICIGATTTLSPNNTTGSWTGFNPTIASISGFTVTGIATGTAKFIYTENSTGCKSDTLRVVVRPRPTVTPTPGPICIGGTTTLSPSSGGTWASSTPLVANVNNFGVVTGLTAGSATFVFTDAATACISLPTGTLTVNALPTVSLSSAASCVGIQRQASPNTGGTWVSNNPAVATINSATGVITPVGQGQTTFTFTNTATGCSRTTNTFIVNPPPVVDVLKDTICVAGTTNLTPATGGTWAALNGTIASLSSGAVVTGISAGMARFRFTEASSGCQAFDTVIVQARPIVTNGAAQICVGSTTQLAPTSGGSWQSSNGSQATVNNAGLVTGIAVSTGVTFVFTSNAGCASLPSAAVVVNNAPTVSLNGDPFLCQGGTRQLTPATGGTWASNSPLIASVTAGGLVTALAPGAVNFTFTQSGSGCTATTGNMTISLPPTITNSGLSTICVGLTTVLNASEPGGTWNALDPSIATISNIGVVTGITAGAARFTYTNGNFCTSLELTVNIQAAVVTSISGPLAICIGGTTNVLPATGGSWASSNNLVATVTPGGLITGVAAGTAEFRFTSAAGCVSAPITSISVDPPPVVSNGPGKVCVGATIPLLPATGGTWASNHPTIASITNGGIVTGLAAGNATFTFTSAAGCSSAATSPVTVNNNPIVTLALNAICVGKFTNAFPNTGGTWSSSTPTVATVNNVGLVTGVGPGTSTFTFTQTSTGCTSNPTVPLTVNAGPAVNVPDTRLCIGETTTLTTTPAATGTWISSNPAVASIGLNTGVVTALTQGQATFVFIDASGCRSIDSAPIIVDPKPSVAIDGNDFICITGTTQLSPSTGGTWVSSNPAVATVSSTGLVTGVAVGTATFRYTDNVTGCISDATLPVTVLAAPIVSITGPTNVCINGTTTLSPNSGGTWVSNNPAVAIVSPLTGVVTAVGPGQATFTYTQNDSGCPATATDPITVTQCLNPDFNATFVNVPVPGDASTNDFATASTAYGALPLLTSSPAGSNEDLVMNPDGTYTFTGSHVGVYKYLVPVCQAPQTAGCPTSDLWITVVDYKEPVRRPIANVDIATTAYQTAVTIKTMENDDCEYVTGCNLDPASVSIITNPKRGSVTSITAAGDIIYTPNSGFVGLDTLVYSICVQGEPSNCAQAKQIITVNGPSAGNGTAAADDFAVTMREVPVSGNVKTNDTDAEGHTQTVTAQNVTVPAGTLVLATDGSYTFTPAVGYFGPVDFPYTTCDNFTTPACADATLHILVVPDLAIKVRVYLEGSLMNNANAKAPDDRPLMRDNLRVSPFNGTNYIPLSDPYKIATTYVDVTNKYTHIAPGNRSDFATIPSPSTVFGVSGQDAIVDWVFVQLRSKTTNTLVLATRSGLLQRDGDVVDLNGIEPLRFPGIPMDDYYVVVRHHRHLSVMTAGAQTPTQLIDLVDFTKTTTPTWDFGAPGNGGHPNGQNYTGLAQSKKVKTGWAAMWGGDFDSNGKIKAENPGDDLNFLFNDVFAYPNNTSNNVNYDFAYGYLPGDYDMNSKSKFDNPNDDKNMLFAQLVTYPLNTSLLSNFDFFIEQLP